MRTPLIVATLLLAASSAAPFAQAASAADGGSDPIAIHPCFQPGTYNIVVLGQETGCIGFPPVEAGALAAAEPRPGLVEVHPCFQPGTYNIVIAGTVSTGCIGVA